CPYPSPLPALIFSGIPPQVPYRSPATHENSRHFNLIGQVKQMSAALAAGWVSPGQNQRLGSCPRHLARLQSTSTLEPFTSRLMSRLISASTFNRLGPSYSTRSSNGMDSS